NDCLVPNKHLRRTFPVANNGGGESPNDADGSRPGSFRTIVRRIFAGALLFLPLLLMVAGPVEAKGQRALRRPDAPVPAQQNRPAAIEEMVDRFYENQIRQKLELTDEQFRQVRPMLRLALRERREITVRRARMIN